METDGIQLEAAAVVVASINELSNCAHGPSNSLRRRAATGAYQTGERAIAGWLVRKIEAKRKIQIRLLRWSEAGVHHKFEARRHHSNHGVGCPAQPHFRTQDGRAAAETFPKRVREYDYGGTIGACFAGLKSATQRRSDTEQFEQVR